jgi:hypothetical protein
MISIRCVDVLCVALGCAALGSAVVLAADYDYGSALVTEISYAQLKPEDVLDANDEVASKAGDWIELFNPSATESIDISGWFFADRSAKWLRKERDAKRLAKHVFKIPASTTPLEPKSFAILARDEMQFRKAYADREVAIKALIRGSFRFGLSGKGETLSLIDATNSTIFELEYDNKSPWPTVENDSSTLEIIDVRLDPNDPYSWIASYKSGGTPGEVNSVANAWR